ncbi:MAG: Trm112 family protein [Candidatus Woesearchaeota archaeon]
MSLNLYSMLVCPKCKGDLKEDSYGKLLHCVKCDIFYHIRDGVPDLRIPKDEKKKKEEQEHKNK